MEFKIVPASASPTTAVCDFPKSFEIHDEHGHRVMVCHTQDEADAELNHLQLLCDLKPTV